jgi:hypothetical protein
MTTSIFHFIFQVVDTSILLGIAAKLFDHSIPSVGELATVVVNWHSIAFTASASAPPLPTPGPVGDHLINWPTKTSRPVRIVIMIALAVLYLLGLSSALVSSWHLAGPPLKWNTIWVLGSGHGALLIARYILPGASASLSYPHRPSTIAISTSRIRHNSESIVRKRHGTHWSLPSIISVPLHIANFHSTHFHDLSLSHGVMARRLPICYLGGPSCQ